MDERVMFEEWAKTQELLERELAHDANDGYYSARATVAHDAWQARAKQVSGWIACADRLPEEGQRVIYADPEGVHMGSFYCGTGHEDAQFAGHGRWRIGGVTHWMPIPPLPASEGDRRG